MKYGVVCSYANLTDLEFLKVEGYIAGVTNPMFQQKREWWDVCCDIATGQVICSERDKTIAHHLIPDKIQKKLMKKVYNSLLYRKHDAIIGYSWHGSWVLRRLDTALLSDVH